MGAGVTRCAQCMKQITEIIGRGGGGHVGEASAQRALERRSVMQIVIVMAFPGSPHAVHARYLLQPWRRLDIACRNLLMRPRGEPSGRSGVGSGRFEVLDDNTAGRVQTG